MTSLQNFFEISTEPTEEYSDGLYISAYRIYESGIDAMKYYITVTDWDSLEDIEEIETTWENMERDLNKMLKKYRVTNGHFEYVTF